MRACHCHGGPLPGLGGAGAECAAVVPEPAWASVPLGMGWRCEPSKSGKLDYSPRWLHLLPRNSRVIK